ncbi:MAG: AI-2E family transporter [Lachnospiraceae bacterium]|nr:AI-2E family transporter [Lachnospiraceae bacterium]
MKWKPDKNQIRWGITAFVTVALLLVFYYLLFHGSRVISGITSVMKSLMPVIYGVVIAYILEPVVHFFEKRLFAPYYVKKGIDLHSAEASRTRSRVRRICIVLTMLLFVFVVYAFLMIIIPQLIKSIQNILRNFPAYVANFTRFTNTYLADHPEMASTINSYMDQVWSWLNGFVNDTLIPQATVMLRRLSLSVVAFIGGVFNFVIGMIIAIYLLNGKEKFKSGAKKMAYALFKEDFANELVAGFRYTHYTFSGFIVGKLVDSLIIGILCYLGALILKTPYPVLMAMIVGVTNIIPFFGPYIGEIFTFILLLLIDPLGAVIFLLFVVVLQQIDGNILGPKILGNSTGLSAFWVIFAVLFFGNILGIAGWILGVPLFAVIYALISRIQDHLLAAKGLPVDTMIYGDAAYIRKNKVVMKKDADWDLYNVRHPTSIWRRIFKFGEKKGRTVQTSGNEKRADDGAGQLHIAGEETRKKEDKPLPGGEYELPETRGEEGADTSE